MSNDLFWELVARKLSGEATENELEELEQILRIHPHLHFSVQVFSDLWQQSADGPTPTEAKEAYSRHLKKLRQQEDSEPIAMLTDEQAHIIDRNTSNPSRKNWLWITAIGILAAGAWWVYALNTKKAEPLAQLKEPSHEVYTSKGSKTYIQLPDGSHVWLNADSKLHYSRDFGTKNREVRLIGEGYFDVTRNPEKPFVIHTALFDVKVLGTRFNVKSYPDDKTTETSLEKGSVEVMVYNRKEIYILKPNQKLVVLNEQAPAAEANSKNRSAKQESKVAFKDMTYQEGDTIAVETAWAYNRLVFEDEPFSEAAKKMERWYDVKFEFRNPIREDDRLTGSFVNETLQQAMDALQFTHRFRYEISGKKVIIY